MKIGIFIDNNNFKFDELIFISVKGEMILYYWPKMIFSILNRLPTTRSWTTRTWFGSTTRTEARPTTRRASSTGRSSPTSTGFLPMMFARWLSVNATFCRSIRKTTCFSTQPRLERLRDKTPQMSSLDSRPLWVFATPNNSLSQI